MSRCREPSVVQSSARADGPFGRHPRGDGPRVGARQLVGHEPRVVEQAREALTGGLEVVKAAGQRRLAAGLREGQRAHEISDGLPLMPVCPGKTRPIIAEASGQRALVHRRNNALTSG